jgi:iron complex outermembrane recepter protein
MTANKKVLWVVAATPLTTRSRFRMRRFTGAAAAATFLFGAAAAQETEHSSADGGAAMEQITVVGHRLREGEITKSGIALAETPQAISVVTAEMIEARGIIDLNDALSSVAGVSRSSTYSYYDAYTIRGYDTAYDSLYLDGLITSSAAGTNNELAGLERVEVLKGPASSLYGAAPIGGVVNLVSKRPLSAPFLDVDVASGSYNLIETAIDANAPLDDDETILGRLNVLYRDSDDFVPHSGKNRLFVAPALTWKLGAATDLTLLGRLQRDRDNPWSPLQAEGTVLPTANGEIPYAFPVNFTGDQKAIHNQERTQLGYILDHAFGDTATFSQTFRYTDTETYWNDWVFADALVDSHYIDGVQQGHVFGLNVYGPFRQSDKHLGIDSRVSLDVGTGAVSHQILVGLDYRQMRNRHAEGGGNYDPTVNTLDWLAPDYTAPLIHDPVWAYADASSGRQAGLYVQDHISFGENWFVTAGGRWDKLRSDGKKDDAFSPRVGVNFLLSPAVALYASWSQSFTPQFSWLASFDGSPLPNGEGENAEVGVKLASSDGKLSGSAAAFELTRTNVPTPDVLHPTFFVVTGEQRSRGFEVEGAWRPGPAWGLSLAYTNLDAVVTEDNQIPVGTQLGNVPRHNLYLRGEYLVQEGRLRGLGASVAVLWNSDKVADSSSFYDADGDGDNDAPFRLPSYLIVDAGFSYEREDWKLSLTLKNAFDERYFPDASYYTRVTIGEPRNWRMSVSKQF